MKKKIVFVLEQLYGGGAERVTNALANEICKKEDYEVHILTYFQDEQNEYPRDDRIIRHNMALNYENKSRLRSLSEKMIFLRCTIKSISPDCVISLAMPKTAILLSVATIGLNIPLILSERNDPVRFPSSKFVRLLRGICYRRCSGVVFQTNEAKSFFSAAVQKKSEVICNPITSNLPDRFEGVREKKIVNFCRLHEQKNLDLLIDAFSESLKTFPEYVLYIYGEGPERNRLSKKITAMNLTDKVFMPGYSDDIYNEIVKAAVFVSSSDYEGISNSMLEAIAIGVPTVCTDCPAGGAREVIQDGVNGLLVPTKDVTAMANAIVRILADSDFAQALSQEGYRLREVISADTIAAQWCRYIESQMI